MNTSIIKCISHLYDFFAVHKIDKSHGMKHALDVCKNAMQAVENDIQVTDGQRTIILLASLLHDIDDKKYFKTVNYANARSILAKLDNQDVETIIELIDLVSCSTNKDSEAELWKLIPRYADRLESIGEIGILRCYEYNLEKKMPLYAIHIARKIDRRAA